MDPSQQDNAPPAHRASTSSGMMSPTDTRANPLSRHSSIIGESVPENYQSTDTVRRRPEGYGRTSDTVIPKLDSEAVDANTSKAPSRGRRASEAAKRQASPPSIALRQRETSRLLPAVLRLLQAQRGASLTPVCESRPCRGARRRTHHTKAQCFP